VQIIKTDIRFRVLTGGYAVRWIGFLSWRFFGCVLGFTIALVASAHASPAEVDQPGGEIGAAVEETGDSGNKEIERDESDHESTSESEPTTFEGQITVTATKREATTQEIPVSIEVLSGERLTDLVIENAFEAAELVPNLTAGFGVVSNFVTIRGVGSGSERSFEQAVAMYVDGVYLPRSRQYGQSFLDVSRVEVMRGPQAVIHGLNATAGAISVVTNRTNPGDPFFTDLRASYEFEYGAPMATAIVGGSPSEKLGLRAAVEYLDTPGYFTNPALGHDEGQIENYDLRFSAVWQPTEKLAVFAKLEHSNNDIAGNAGEIFALNAQQVEPDDGVLNWRRSSTNSGVNPFGVFGQDEPAIVFGGTTASVDVELAVGSGSLVLIGSWTDFSHDRTTDIDTTANPVYDWEVLEQFEKAALDVRWASAPDVPLSAMAGVYYHTTDLVNDATALWGPGAAGAGQSVASSSVYDLDSDLFSAFAQLTWRVDPSVRLLGGVRYAREQKEVFRDSTCWLGILPDELVPMPPDGPIGLCPDARLNGYNDDRTSSNLMPEIGIEWDIRRDTMLYGKIITSAKAGGYASAIVFNPDYTPEYGDEKAIGYEIGLRSSFSRGILSATAFLTDFDDLQVNSFVIDNSGNVQTLTQIVNNAGGARSKGIELQARWLPTSWLSTGASIAWLDARYTSYPDGPCNSSNDDPRGTCDLSGEKLPFAPDWSLSIFADVRYRLTSKLALLAGLDIAASDSYLTDGTLDPEAMQGSWVRLSARLGLGAPDDRWSVSLVGRNLTKEPVLASSQGFGQYFLGYLEPPRTVTLLGTYRFR
jgi:iron complex outermembrane receptor protein